MIAILDPRYATFYIDEVLADEHGDLPNGKELNCAIEDSKHP